MDIEKIRSKVADFLKKNEMDHEDIDIEKYINIFIEEMRNGLAGQDSSLEMIPTYIEIGKEVPINEPVIAIDAGGANFRVATVYFNDRKKPVIENLKKYQMPGTKGKINHQKFFQVMAGYLKEVVKKSSNIGFCFSYAAEILPNKDGKVIRLAKELEVEGIEGQMVGENLLTAIKTLGYTTNKHVVILNDTVTALLAGISSFPDRTFDSYVGFILGAGTNTCYIEQNKNIIKNKDLDPARSQIINVESGGFGKGPLSVIDRQFDKSTENPGEGTFEKMISGAYFGPMGLKTIQVAAEDGLFSSQAAKELEKIEQISTEDISDFMYYPNAERNPLSSAFNGGSGEDLITLYYLIDKLVERAAKLTAINLSSVVIKSGKGTNPCFPVCIVAEGTTFYRLKSLKTRVEFYMKTYLENQKNLYYEIVDIENATLIGAAIAGLTN